MESSGFSQFSFSVWAVLAIVLGVAIAYISFAHLINFIVKILIYAYLFVI